MTLDQFKGALELASAVIYSSHERGWWYACIKTKIPSRECESNKGKAQQLVIYPHQIGGAEVQVTGEYNCVWYSLKAYSLTFDEAINRLNEIEESLIGAWNALEKTSS